MIRTIAQHNTTIRADQQPEATSDCDDDYYVVHQGRMKRTFEELPQIASITLASGWTPSKIRHLKQAIQTCVRENPILSGIVVVNKEGIFIEPGHYQPQKHSFWSVDESLLEATSALSKKWASAMASPQGRLHFVEQEVASRLPSIISIPEEAKHQTPLFCVHLLPLPNNHLLYSFRLSHAVGDATTYYRLINQVMALVDATDKPTTSIPKIDWRGLQQQQRHHHRGPSESKKNKPDTTTQPELYLDHMSKRDIENLYGVPFMAGVVPRFVQLQATNKRQQYVLLRKDQIQKQKKHQKSSSVDYLTTNDVVVASICRANQRVKVMCEYVNMRPKPKTHNNNDDNDESAPPLFLGGNYLHEIPFSRKAATNPNVVHRITQHKIYYETNQVPILPSLTNQIGKISNWSSCYCVGSSSGVHGTTILAHIPTPDQVNEVPLDYAVIFAYDENHIGLLHNFDPESVDLTEMMMTLS